MSDTNFNRREMLKTGALASDAPETGWVRVTVGTTDEMKSFVKAMRTIFES
ncbi:MAG TPA: hypothetical protein VGC87_16530 [Pyrinomonadaceae bacterium]